MATNTWQNGSTYSNRYLNQFTYDASGNILTQVHHAENGTQIENLSYKYERNANGHLLRNRLYHVNETVSAGAFADDIDDQGTFTTTNINVNNNYGYDEEGRLVRDDAEDIAQIKWTVTSKVKEVIRSNGSPKKNLKFDYDASGKRIAKHVYNSSNVWEKSSYYTYDATGNVMAVYEKVSTDPDDLSMITYHVIERHMYGSSRIGSNNLKFELSGTTAIPDTGKYVHIIGKKQYEYSNHLGNVLATTSDKLIAKDWNNDNTVDSYKAEILSATDYTPFGVAMDGRTFTADKARYGFNGKEKDDEWNVDGGSYDFGARMYDSRLGRWLSVDPLQRKYPDFSPYCFVANMPIKLIDSDGRIIVDPETGLPVDVSIDKDGQLVFGANVPERTKTALTSAYQVDIGKKMIRDAIESADRIAITTSDDIVLVPGADAANYGVADAQDGEYYRLFGLTTPEIKNIDGEEVLIMVSTIYLGTINSDAGDNSAIDNGNILITHDPTVPGRKATFDEIVKVQTAAANDKIMNTQNSPPFVDKEQGLLSTTLHELRHAIDLNSRGEGPSERVENKARKQYAQQQQKKLNDNKNPIRDFE